jgi:membrane protein
MMSHWAEGFDVLLEKITHRARHGLGVLKQAASGFLDARGTQAAAGIAYYAFFSIFPLLVALIAGASYFLQQDQIHTEVVGFLQQAFPVSQQLIEKNINQVLNLRGPVGFVGLITLIWAGANVFTVLVFNINLAWASAPERSLVRKRLTALVIVGVLAGLLVVSLLLTATLDFAAQSQRAFWRRFSIYGTSVWSIVTKFLPWLFMFALFLNLYRWVPNTKVRWSEASWGGLIAAVGWRIVTMGFTWYLSSGVAHYELVYGSLAAVVALLFWIYLSSLVILFGAHVSAAIAHESARRPVPRKIAP